MTDDTKWSLNLTFKMEKAGIIAVSGGGEKVYSASKKWNQYKETWKLTGTLKTYNPTGNLIKTEQRNETYIKYKKVAIK
ncbi:hypothetical protein ABE132_18040 [Peribacillus simplex]|uniref:hypothetical protein n=1 Tax=Peribacillus simplex TaxID=1478 RepID=UPI003D2DF413